MDADQLSGRGTLESLISADLREIATESDQIGRLLALSHRSRPNDFRALLHIMVAENAGQPMTSVTSATGWACPVRLPPTWWIG